MGPRCWSGNSTTTRTWSPHPRRRRRLLRAKPLLHVRKPSPEAAEPDH
ncbi:hypothetical protein MMON44395_21475 [Mycolicibacterium monacense DSM 44395]|nr:hypothetical protein [Mycolicibacterium monacense DSM 44395]